jgi:plastocyanin
VITVALALVLAANAAPPPATDLPTLAAEVARLQHELREQKQLLLQLMQVDQQRYDMLLQIIRSQQGGQPTAMPAIPSLPGLPRPDQPAGSPAAAAEKAIKESGSSGTVSGKVSRLPKDAGEVYVYLDGSGQRVRGKALEIKQKDKQFAPRVAVVPMGTKLSFPNYDAVFHNVFSRSPGNAFDLGGIKAGEKPGSVVVSQPGHVEIFCNIHSKMRADILVVPSNTYAKVRPDGSFELSSVPIGSRKLVLWGPNIKPASQRVDVTPAGASVSFAAEAAPVRPHTNKVGQPYGSYDE